MLLFVAMMLLSGCGREDTKLRQQISGTWKRDNTTWTRDEVAEMTLSTNGAFVTKWTTAKWKLTIEGIWTVQGGVLILKSTNCLAEGTTNYMPVGTVERSKIIQADGSVLVVEDADSGRDSYRIKR